MRRPEITLSLAALAAANLAPLAGVAFLGWDAGAIVLLYWTENLIVGFYNVLRMATVKVAHPGHHLGKPFVISFFCVHFGGFCAGHGVFLLAFFKLSGGMDSFFPEHVWPGPLVFLQLLGAVVARLWESHPPGMEWPVLALIISHGASFVDNHLLKGEYARLTVPALMARPYVRIVLLHVAIIAGALPVMMLGSPAPLLFILVGLKIVMDAWLHLRSHRAAPAGTGGPAGRANPPDDEW